MFAVVKLFRQMTYKIGVRAALTALCKRTMRVVVGAKPHPAHRARAELLMGVTYLRETAQVEGACPGHEDRARGAERRIRKQARVSQLLMLLNFAWSA